VVQSKKVKKELVEAAAEKETRKKKQKRS